MFNDTVSFTSFFFFNDTATTEIYTLSLHDALPISRNFRSHATSDAPWRPLGNATTAGSGNRAQEPVQLVAVDPQQADRKSTRLNSSHANISYAVFCLKKKNTPPTS